MPKILAAELKLEEPVEQTAISEPQAEPEAKPKRTRKAQPKLASETAPETKPKPGGFRYAGSLAEKWDQVLEKGGSWASMAKECDVTPGRLRAHAKHRTGRGSHTMREQDDRVQLIPA